MIRVVVPAHLRTLARIGAGDVLLEVEGPITLRSVLDALEAKHPMLRGTVRDHVTLQRRAFVRFFACAQDLSHNSHDSPLPDAVASGAEPLLIVGAVAGGCIAAVEKVPAPTHPRSARSFIESWRRFNISARDYLIDILPGLDDRPVCQVAQLTPSRWAAAKGLIPARG